MSPQAAGGRDSYKHAEMVLPESGWQVVPAGQTGWPPVVQSALQTVAFTGACNSTQTSPVPQKRSSAAPHLEHLLGSASVQRPTGVAQMETLGAGLTHASGAVHVIVAEQRLWQ